MVQEAVSRGSVAFGSKNAFGVCCAMVGAIIWYFGRFGGKVPTWGIFGTYIPFSNDAFLVYGGILAASGLVFVINQERNAQLWGALFWLAIGAFVAWQGLRLDLGKVSDPGSGFALFWIGLIMTALALNEVVKAVVKGGESLASLWEDTRWQKVLLVTVMLLVFGFAFETIGFVLCSLGLLLILMFFVDPVGWKKAIIVAVSSTLIVWAVLTEVLRIQMPAGLLAGAPEDALRSLVRGIGAAISAVIR